MLIQKIGIWPNSGIFKTIGYRYINPDTFLIPRTAKNAPRRKYTTQNKQQEGLAFRMQVYIGE